MICFARLMTLFVIFFAGVSTAQEGPSQSRNVLFEAVENGDIALVIETLNRGANPDVYDGLGRTPLIEAASDGQVAIARALLDAGATPDLTRWRGRTPLMEAVSLGHLEVAQILLNAGADIDAQSENGWTSLTWAVVRDERQAVTLLRASGASIDPPPTDEPAPSLTLLHAAAWARNNDLIRELANSGWSADMRDAEGTTALLDVVEKQTRQFYKTAEKQVKEVLQLAATVRVLLEIGADPNARDPAGSTALHYAVQGGRSEIVLALLEGGADPNVADADGLTPLIHARQHHIFLAEPLTSAGANTSAGTWYVAGLAASFLLAAFFAFGLLRFHGPAIRLLSKSFILMPVVILLTGIMVNISTRVDFWHTAGLDWTVKVYVPATGSWVIGQAFGSKEACENMLAELSETDVLQGFDLKPDDVQQISCSYRSLFPSPLWGVAAAASYAFLGLIVGIAQKRSAWRVPAPIIVVPITALLVSLDATHYDPWVTRVNIWTQQNQFGMKLLVTEAVTALISSTVFAILGSSLAVMSGALRSGRTGRPPGAR